MIKIAKYEFSSKLDFLDLLENFPLDNIHSVIELGNIEIKKEVCSPDGDLITPAIFSDRYHVDVVWNGLENQPKEWEPFAVDIDGDGYSKIIGVSYQENKF